MAVNQKRDIFLCCVLSASFHSDAPLVLFLTPRRASFPVQPVRGFFHPEGQSASSHQAPFRGETLQVSPVQLCLPQEGCPHRPLTHPLGWACNHTETRLHCAIDLGTVAEALYNVMHCLQREVYTRCECGITIFFFFDALQRYVRNETLESLCSSFTVNNQRKTIIQ